VKLKKSPQFGVFPVIRKHEAEIVSNRKLVSYGEFFIKSCTHRLSRWENDHVNKCRLPMPVYEKCTYICQFKYCGIR
jgi:3-phenylpropionate/cinnamic acid dioxygenase small subunit